MAEVVDTDAARDLIDAGAQVIEVLPESAWRRERLPGAISIPLPELRSRALEHLRRDAATVVYCYDHECDLSPRAAAVLEALGFTQVYDYADSKTAWLGAGLPAEGDVADGDRAGARASRPPTCSPDATIAQVAALLEDEKTAVVVVVNDDDVVLGALHPEAASLPGATSVLAAADPGPPTVRPSITRFELARSMDEHQQRHILVSTSTGRLIGLVRRAELG